MIPSFQNFSLNLFNAFIIYLILVKISIYANIMKTQFYQKKIVRSQSTLGYNNYVKNIIPKLFSDF